MADPDLQIIAGPGHPALEIGGSGAVSKNFFRPFGPQFDLKIRGRPRPLPWIRHWGACSALVKVFETLHASSVVYPFL